MITPAYGLTASAISLPKLALDFTTAVLDSRITFARALNTATRINQNGLIELVNADLPRFNYDPITLVCQGLLIEESRTNLLLNSLIDGTSLPTQSVTVTAAAHTLSFYGTGEIVLSGAHSATVTGTGAYPVRKTYTFTPTAGSLTLTVTGTVQFANLGLGAFATSFIPTDGTTKTRNADVATMTGTNFSSWFNASEGTFAATFLSTDSVTGRNSTCLSCDDGTTGSRTQIVRNISTSAARGIVVNSTVQAQISSGTFNLNEFGRYAFAYKVDSFSGAFNGTLLTPDNTGSLPTVTQMQIGNGAGTNYLNGIVKNISYWPQRLINAEVQAFSKQG